MLSEVVVEVVEVAEVVKVVKVVEMEIEVMTLIKMVLKLKLFEQK